MPIKLSFGLFQSKMTDFTPAQSKQQFIYEPEISQQPSSPQDNPQPNITEDLCFFSRKINEINPEIIQVRSRRKQRSKKSNHNNSFNQNNGEQKHNLFQQQDDSKEYAMKSSYQKKCLQNCQDGESYETKNVQISSTYNNREMKIQQYVYNEDFQDDKSYEQQYDKEMKQQKSQLKIKHPPKLQHTKQSSKMTKTNISKTTIATVDSIQNKIPFKKQSESLTVNSQFSGLKRNPVIIQDRYQNVITHVVPPGYKIPCYIKIENRFFGLSCQYSLFIKQKNEFSTPILSAKKQLLKISSNFIISKNYQYNRISKRQSSCLGILKANFSGRQFKYFRKIIEIQEDNKEQFQQLKCVINYQSNILGYKGPRNIEVAKTKPTLKPTFENSLEHILESHQKDKLQIINSVKPKKTKNGMYVVDFKGKAKVPSAKNMILADKKDKQCLVLAKQSDDCFLMEISYPLSIAQGFAICLSSLDSKMLCN